jgi:hypothetical protein
MLKSTVVLASMDLGIVLRNKKGYFINFAWSR